MSLRAACASALLLLLALLPSACMKRVPVSAGGDRALEAGAPARLGQPLELPEGARVAWELGDGVRAEGAEIEHTWQRPGDYTLRVEIVDPDGERRADTARVRVTRPPLERAAPDSAQVVLWLPRPAAEGAALSRLPLLLERLVADGQAANALLAGAREALGFDPFSAAGWRTAGLDPQGDLAWLGLDVPGTSPPRAVGLMAIAAGDEAVLQAHLGRALAGADEARWQPRAGAEGLQELRATGDGRLLGLAVQARGYLWLAPTDALGEGPADAERALGPLLRADGPRLAGLPAWRELLGRRPPGGLCLWLREIDSGPGPDGEGGLPPGGLPPGGLPPGGLPPGVRAALGGLRLDLDLGEADLGLDGWLQLRGPEAASLAAVLRARRAPPAFDGRVPPGSHALLKLSLDAVGLARLVAGWLGQDEGWRRAQEAIDQLSAQTGLDVRGGLLDNLGDSYLLSLRLRPAALLARLDDPAAAGPDLAELCSGRLVAQALDPERLRLLLAALLPAVGLGLDAAVRDGLLEIALPAPAAPPPDGPGGLLAALPDLDAPGRQVLALDLRRLRLDLRALGPGDTEGMAGLIRSVLWAGLEQAGELGLLRADAELTPTGLWLRISLDLR
ncbi:MAG TPA: PKD domain-containing protein [Myxococcota bacterium]|nr:PKD domain-containing protein [Myxococcota bacterium]HRY96259.1 PKD domain-containing protein [Myxococcota bacterium]HSA20449.1 PKD domain-containing protein [Myxococcota bacterium]